MLLPSFHYLERATKAAIVIAAVMLVAVAITVQGFATDGPTHVRWLSAFSDIMQRGHLYPRWLPEPYGGLGSSAFYFYPPLTYWLGTPLWILFDPVDPLYRFSIVAFLGSVISFITCRYALKIISPDKDTFWPSLFYVVGPYHVFDLYYRFGLSSHFAFIFYPILAAALVMKPGYKKILLAAVGFAGLVLTNVPAALIAMIIISVYVIVVWVRIGEPPYNVVLGGILAMTWTAFYWLPIPFIREYTQIAHLSRDSLSLLDVVGAIDSLSRKWLITESINTLVMYTAAIILSVIFWRTKGDKIQNGLEGGKTRLLILTVAVLILVFVNQWITGFLWWDNRFNTLIQFPYRWFPFILLALSIAYGSDKLMRRRAVVTLVMALSCFSIFLSSLQVFDLRVNPRETEDRTPYDPPEYAPVYSRKGMQENIELARSYENAPQIVALRSLNEGERITETAHDVHHLEYDVILKRPASVRFQQWYWPFWKLTKDGGELSVSPNEEGLAVAALPAGYYTISYDLIETSWEKWGRAISLSGLIAVVIGAVVIRRKRVNPRRDS